MQRVLDLVKRTATAKLAMPTNIEMGKMLGNRGRQSVAKAFDKLVAIGKIRVDVRHGRRRVYVVGQRMMTGWGECRVGHAPYSKRPRGAVKEKIIVPEPKQIGRAEGFFLLGIESFRQYEYRRQIIGSQNTEKSALKCQFIVSPEDSYIPVFCGDKSEPGHSWCAAHKKIVYC